MLRQLVCLSSCMLFASSALAMTELDKALCKERRELCRNSQPQPKQKEEPKAEAPQAVVAPSGPGWKVIEGESKRQIVDYLVQVMTSSSYVDCHLKGMELEVKGDTTYVLNLKHLPAYARMLEEQENSERPLFRISGPNSFNKYEMFITTNPQRTLVTNILYNEYKEIKSQRYVGPLDKPELVKLEGRMPVKTVSCTTN